MAGHDSTNIWSIILLSGVVDMNRLDWDGSITEKFFGGLFLTLAGLYKVRLEIAIS